jgi:lysozyme
MGDLIVTERLVSRVKQFEQMAGDSDGDLRTELAVIALRLPYFVHVPMTQGQFEALIDFAYSCGFDELKNSALLRCLNDENLAGAIESFRHWKPSQGELTQDLYRRRMEERAWFLGIL